MLTGATINTITATSNTSENTVALAKVLASNTSNNYLKMRMHSIEFDYFVSSTTSERLQSNNNNRSFEIVTIDDATNNYNRFVKPGVNANTFANVTIGTGLITNAEVIYSGLGFKDGELLDFTLGTNAQAVVGTATANGTGIGVGYTKLNSGVLGEKFSIHAKGPHQQRFLLLLQGQSRQHIPSIPLVGALTYSSTAEKIHLLPVEGRPPGMSRNLPKRYHDP